jgi:hypothetical protein
MLLQMTLTASTAQKNLINGTLEEKKSRSTMTNKFPLKIFGSERLRKTIRAICMEFKNNFSRTWSGI